MKEFALWLAATPPSVFIAEHNAWTIPLIQSIHIAGIGAVMGSALLIVLRVLGLTWTDETLGQVVQRFGPWVTGTLWLLLVTGALMVVGEPSRELLAFSFWLKMSLVAIGAIIVTLFRRSLRAHPREWEGPRLRRLSTRVMAVTTFLLWFAVIVLGRLIAYDHIWGSWSPAAGQ